MKAKVLGFGAVEIGGKRYDHDVVIENGEIRKRSKKPSKQYRAQFGHTPLSVAEDIPWGGAKLVVGSGYHGRLPVMDAVYAEADERGVEIVVMPTQEVCDSLHEMDLDETNVIVHVTC